MRILLSAKAKLTLNRARPSAYISKVRRAVGKEPDMKNSQALSLHIPEPRSRPGQPADFSDVDVSHPGAVPRPDIAADPDTMRELAYGLIRVLDDHGEAVGPWNPRLATETLLSGLRAMMLTRAYDDRMYRAQRQGRISFFMKSRGEEAVAVAAAMALDRADMTFPTYRQQGLLVARGYPLIQMAHQVYSDALDPMKGRQLPSLYSSRDAGFFSISGNLGTQFSQAVGWAMASAYKGDDRIAAAWIGDGATAEADFHHALTFASVYRAPVILNIVNNQWAISSFQGLAGGEETTFAARAIGYGLPALRVDGNDFLAVYAATAWAAERARANHGATVIELFTYRAESHSTSDDPSRYRPADEAARWPLGDPIGRLAQHLASLRVWSEEQQAALQAELEAEVQRVQREAQATPPLGSASPERASDMFEDVYAEPPWHLRQQAEALKAVG
jgi:2-oxoisovalerate dehydrogenase E1 component alpha subunit